MNVVKSGHACQFPLDGHGLRPSTRPCLPIESLLTPRQSDGTTHGRYTKHDLVLDVQGYLAQKKMPLFSVGSSLGPYRRHTRRPFGGLRGGGDSL